MHSFLIVGNKNNLDQEVESLVKRLKLERLDYRLVGIEDVRNLKSLTKLKTSQPSAIVLKDIDQATTEALNALLKSLEEPQKDLHYILTAQSEHQIIPTILSRCQTIRVANEKQKLSSKAVREFFTLSPEEKLSQTSTVKDRDLAISFVNKLILYSHHQLISQRGNQKRHTKNLIALERARSALKANGNVQLQLTNMVISLV